MKFLIWFILIAVCIFFIHKFLSRFKFPKIGAIGVFVGGVKSGKSATSLACALSNYRSVVRSWKIQCFFIKFLNKFRKNKISLPTKPLFYSSIPLRYIPYIPITREHLLRKRRFAPKSVVFIDEASLVADSQLIKDKQVNNELLLFFKLFGHSCKGKCIVNTHCITDLHYALKRCTSQYFYIHHLSKYIPFITLSYLREERYSEDNANVNAWTNDVEDGLKRCLMLSSTFKKYDAWCYSVFTDNLPTDSEEDCILKGKNDSLKAEEIVSFRKEFYELKKNNMEIEKNEKKNS